MTDKEFLYKIAQYLENNTKQLACAAQRVRLIAKSLPLIRTTLTEEDAREHKRIDDARKRH